MEKQMTFFQPEEGAAEQKYTTGAGSPIYVPGDRRPHLLHLCDVTKRDSLLRHIRRAVDTGEITEEQAAFLESAAQRHMVFNYELIADYYAHADPGMQWLMEQSALVIIDVEKAIENGYVQLSESVRKLYAEAEVEAGNA